LFFTHTERRYIYRNSKGGRGAGFAQNFSEENESENKNEKLYENFAQILPLCPVLERVNFVLFYCC
jgi:hypothetical protein